MHIIQKEFIKRLVLENKQRYSALTAGYSIDDNVAFHIKQLLKREFIKKRDQFYFITKSGIEASTEFDLATLEDKKGKTLYIGFVCEYKSKYLIRKRISENSYLYKLPGGKPFFGEDMSEALPRIFLKDTGVLIPSTSFVYDSIHFKIQKTTKGDVLFDDALVIYKVNLNGNFEFSLRKENLWMNISEIERVNDRWPEVDICILKDSWAPTKSYSFISDYNININDI